MAHWGIHSTVFPAAVIVGGIDTMSQSLALAKKPHVIIGKLMCWGCGV